MLLIKGAKVGIPDGGLRISMDGQGRPHASISMHMAVDVTPIWLDIAVSRAIASESRREEVLARATGADADGLTSAMEGQVAETMQCVLAAAVAIEAFYGVVSRDFKIPTDLVAKWRHRRTARERQIAEVLRRAFRLPPADVKMIQTGLKELFRYRNMAVHPPARLQPPVWYDALQVPTEWRFGTFCFANARVLCQFALATVAQLVRVPVEAGQLKDSLESLQPRVVPIVARWEAKYGKLLVLPGQAASAPAS